MMQVLIAEDDFVSQKILTRILREQGYETICFADGQSAFDSFKANPVSIIISDWMMPGMDGIAFCQSVRALQLPEYTHFIMLTAKTGPEHYRTAMNAGVDDFLNKPVNKEDLFLKLRVTERIIRQRREAEAKIRSLARFPEDNPNPVLRIDAKARICYVNKACQPLMREWRRQLGDALPRDLLPLVARTATMKTQKEAEVVCGRNTYSFAVTSVHDGETTYLYGHNITDRKQAEQALVELKNEAVKASLHDQLTGLPNRVLLMEHMAHNLARCGRDRTHMAVVMVDIDHFKTINDSLGHQVGDQVLVLVSQCLREQLRGTDTVCRWGGDELMLLLPDLEDRRYAPLICRKLADALQQKVARSSLSLPVTLSMGYAVFPDDAAESEALMQHADHALYEAKADGRNCWRGFMGYGTRYEAKGKPSLYLRLNRAIENQLIDAYFQPIVDATTRRVASLEALARWQDRYDGWVSPEVFVALAEEKGLIQAIGQQITSKTFLQLRHLRDMNYPVTISLNLSRDQLIDAKFQPWIMAAAERFQLQHNWIILEMTERESLLKNSLVRKHLDALAEAGFRLSLDDFGTGFASMDVVAEMPFHELKIPQAICRKLGTEKGYRIVKAIVDMAKALGLTVVAEGVETEAMAGQLRETGVDKLQGYLFSKPLPARDIPEFVKRTGAIGNLRLLQNPAPDRRDGGKAQAA